MLRFVPALFLMAAVPVIPTKKEPVKETLHGVEITDPYRWLETSDNPEVKSWTDAQNALMRKTLDAVPARGWIEERLWQLFETGALGVPEPKGLGKRPVAKSGAKGAGNAGKPAGEVTKVAPNAAAKPGKPEATRYFYTRRTGKQNQPVLYVRDGVKGEDRVLVDVNALAADGTRALDWWFPSEDGKLVAYGVSANGDENSTLRVRDVATGKDLPDTIPQARAASVAWRPDGRSFYYTRYPAPGSVPAGEDEYHRSVFFHRLGTDPAKDPQIFGEGRDKRDWPQLQLSPDGRWLAVEVSQGWSKSELFLLDTTLKAKPKAPPPAPLPMVTGQEAIYTLVATLDDRLYVLSNEGAPRYRIFSVDPKKPERSQWQEVLPEGPETIESATIVGGKIAAVFLKDASSRLRLFTGDGFLEREIVLPTLGTITGLGGRPEGRELFFGFSSYLVPTLVQRFDLDANELATWQALTSPIDAKAFEVEQVRYPSKDGTSIPMFLVHKKNLEKNGQNPTLLYGYGGFNISLTPGFAAAVGPFLERGGVYAVANLRGGGEYGEAWHKAGMLGNKQNVFDDFAAAAQYLIKEKITSPRLLAASGRSNGGLLAGAALTQHPELFQAVIVGVPLLDMLRYHKFRIAQLWIPEYGSSDDEAAFKWLRAYSPYHNVKDGTDYPAALIFTAESDTRVDPMHARKMTARLQAATSGKRPVLLRLETQAGHGAGKPLAKVIAQAADELSFLFLELGLKANLKAPEVRPEKGNAP